MDGDTLAISGYDGYIGYNPRGAIFIYKRINNVWTHQTTLYGGGDYFGANLAIKGNTLAVFSSYHYSYIGIVHMYQYDGSNWNFQNDIVIGLTSIGDFFNVNMALDNNILALDYQDVNQSYPGSVSPVIIYTPINGQWTYQTTLVPDGGSGTQLSMDNNTLAVVAPGASAHGGINIFTYDGSSWSKQALIKLTSTGDYLGSGILTGNISLAGNTLAALSDVVYLFYRTGTTWTTTAPYTNVIFTPGRPESISLGADATDLVVGSNVGDVYQYLYNGTGWTYENTLPHTDNQYDDLYGASVSIYGNTIAVGAPKWWNDNISRGKVYLYDFQVANQPPVADAGPNQTVNEGQSVTLNGSGSTDPDGISDIASYSWSFGDGATASGITVNHTYANNGIYTATLTVTDSVNQTSSATTTTTVNNVPPSVGTLSPITSVLPGVPIDTNANFTDPGILDTHAAVFDWGDGSSSNDIVTEANGSGNVTGSHTYTTPGVYIITLTVTDNDGGIGTNSTNVTILTPAEATSGLVGTVQTFNFQQGIENSLDLKLQNAVDSLNAENAGNRQDAINKLQAFISAVQAQSGNKITPDQANILIQDAQQIINSI